MTDREKGRSKKEKGERGWEKVEEGEKIMQKGEEGEKKERMETGRKGWEERRRVPHLPCCITGAIL